MGRCLCNVVLDVRSGMEGSCLTDHRVKVGEKLAGPYLMGLLTCLVQNAVQSLGGCCESGNGAETDSDGGCHEASRK